MNQLTLRQQIDSVSWGEFAQPEWNKPRTVALALTSAAISYDAKSSTEAYNKVLCALGNNHAGAYYPVLLAALPLLESMIQGSALWPQRTALCLLDDLLASFSPEPGYETASINGTETDIEVAFRSGALALRPIIQYLANSNGPNAQLACELAVLMNENSDESR